MQLPGVPTPKVPLATILTWPRMVWKSVGPTAGLRTLEESMSWWMAYRGGARRPHWSWSGSGLELRVDVPRGKRGGPRR